MRRILIYRMLVMIAFLCLIAASPKYAKAAPPDSLEASEQISPLEDLMREHGVLNRVLLIYEEIIRRSDNNEEFPSVALFESTVIVRNFIQNYHEKLEEQHLFTRFRKAEQFVDLVATLNQQHQAGRKLIDDVIAGEKMQNPDDKKKLTESLRFFIRLYRPHKAREDTVLFPALHTIVSAQEYNALGERFEAEEHRLFGEDGFEKIVGQVEAIEKLLGIYELAQFTPIIPRYN